MKTITNWTADRLPSLTGKRYFITGANAGIGLVTAKELRRAGANVVLGARSEPKGLQAVADVRTIPGDGDVDLVLIDLSSMASVRRAADELHQRFDDGFDAIINNAGVMQTPERRTEDGFELQLATNHLGHFLLNALTIDLVAKRAGRITSVASLYHHQSKGFDFDNIMLEGNYDETVAYTQSKLANLLYGAELSRRLEAAGSPMISTIAHPGYSATNLQSSGPQGIRAFLYRFLNATMAQPAERGALPSLLAAAGTEAENNGYYGPTGFGSMRGPVGNANRSTEAEDTVAARRLWEASEDLVGVKFTIPATQPAAS